MLDSKEEIKQKIDIVELIGEYLQLKPAGSHGFKAVCPFHSEKTPSFHVSSDRQIWHCFGCGEGGDCFGFVMKMEGMDFPEALMHLGQKTGIEVRRLSTTHGNLKQRLHEINDLASRYYHKVLADSETAKTTRAYIEQRGITTTLVEKFFLGYAPDGWDNLTQFLLKRRFSETEIIHAGLANKRKSGAGAIDRFRGRLMIPLRDQHGKTVGFTARLIHAVTAQAGAGDPAYKDASNSSSSPKYINSPETQVYHKGGLLFGLDMAKLAIKEHKAVIVVEGNLDVIASHKAGVLHVVASSGTALTVDQVQLLGRYAKSLIFCFDQDAAGLIAAKRGVSIARAQQFDVRAIVLPDTVKDPDDLVQKDASAWKRLCEHSVPFMEYLIGRVIKGKNLSNVDDKRAVSQELLPALGEIDDPIEREHWTSHIAHLFGVEQEQIRDRIKSLNRSANLNTKVLQQEKKTPKYSKQTRAGMVLLGAWINGTIHDEQLDELLTDSSCEVTGFLDLYNATKKLYHSPSYAPTQSFFSRLSEHVQGQQREDLLRLLNEISLLAEKTFSDLSQNSVQTNVELLKTILIRDKDLRKRRVIAQKIREAELAGDAQAVQRFLAELN